MLITFYIEIQFKNMNTFLFDKKINILDYI